MALVKNRFDFLNSKATKSLTDTIIETDSQFDLIKKRVLSDKAPSEEELETFLKTCKKHTEVTSILCGTIPKNEAEAQAALNVAREFFSFEKKSLKAFSKYLEKRVKGECRRRPEGQNQLTQKEWISPKNGKIQKLLSQLSSFAKDAEMLMSLAVSLETETRILRGFYGISTSTTFRYLKKLKKNMPLNRKPLSSKKQVNESGEEWRLRRLCALKIFNLAYNIKKPGKPRSDDIAEAILVTAALCSNFRVWKTKRSFAWWVCCVEKIIAGRTKTMRRANICSPHK